MNTYDPSMPTDLDWVRFLVGDTGDPPQFTDDEIMAFVTPALVAWGPGPWIRYFVAADILDAMLVRWAVASKGITSESVSKLSISRGGSNDFLQGRAAGYRATAAGLRSERPYLIEAV